MSSKQDLEIQELWVQSGLPGLFSTTTQKGAAAAKLEPNSDANNFTMDDDDEDTREMEEEEDEGQATRDIKKSKKSSNSSTGRRGSSSVRAKFGGDVDLKDYFDHPLADVAKMFGVSLTMMKRQCRKASIWRWPHRQVRSINFILEGLHNCYALAMTDEEKAWIQVQIEIQMKRKHFVCRAASSKMDGAVRNAIFKSNPDTLVNEEELFDGSTLSKLEDTIKSLSEDARQAANHKGTRDPVLSVIGKNPTPSTKRVKSGTTKTRKKTPAKDTTCGSIVPDDGGDSGTDGTVAGRPIAKRSTHARVISSTSASGCDMPKVPCLSAHTSSESLYSAHGRDDIFTSSAHSSMLNNVVRSSMLQPSPLIHPMQPPLTHQHSLAFMQQQQAGAFWYNPPGLPIWSSDVDFMSPYHMQIPYTTPMQAHNIAPLGTHTQMHTLPSLSIAGITTQPPHLRTSYMSSMTSREAYQQLQDSTHSMYIGNTITSVGTTSAGGGVGMAGGRGGLWDIDHLRPPVAQLERAASTDSNMSRMYSPIDPDAYNTDSIRDRQNSTCSLTDDEEDYPSYTSTSQSTLTTVKVPYHEGADSMYAHSAVIRSQSTQQEPIETSVDSLQSEAGLVYNFAHALPNANPNPNPMGTPITCTTSVPHSFWRPTVRCSVTDEQIPRR